MEHAKRLYLVDEFDRVYKQLQRPSAAVAKTHSSIHLSNLLDNSQLNPDEKVRQYVSELHRYLNLSALTPQQKQQPHRPAVNINTSTLPVVQQEQPQPLHSLVKTRARSAATAAAAVAAADDDKDVVVAKKSKKKKSPNKKKHQSHPPSSWANYDR